MKCWQTVPINWGEGIRWISVCHIRRGNNKASEEIYLTVITAVYWSCTETSRQQISTMLKCTFVSLVLSCVVSLPVLALMYVMPTARLLMSLRTRRLVISHSGAFSDTCDVESDGKQWNDAKGNPTSGTFFWNWDTQRDWIRVYSVHELNKEE